MSGLSTATLAERFSFEGIIPKVKTKNGIQPTLFFNAIGVRFAGFLCLHPVRLLLITWLSPRIECGVTMSYLRHVIGGDTCEYLKIQNRRQ